MKLDLRDFFEAFDRDDPYMLAAVSELYGELSDKAPELLNSETNWYQTSYNASGIVVGKGFRGNYAGIGATYMTNVATMGVGSTDIFINQQPYPSWSIGVGTASWYAPIDGPPDLTDSDKAAGKFYIWDEDAYNADTNSPKTVGWALTT